MCLIWAVLFQEKKKQNRHNPEKHQKNLRKKWKYVEDLFVSLTGEEKQEEVILPNKRFCSVGWSDDPVQHWPQQDDTENDDNFS